LLVISANLHKNVEDVMEDVCAKQETECIDGNSVMPSASYDFPDGNRLKSNKKLLIELATCSYAADLYLPNAGAKIIGGKEIAAKQEHVFKSTMSDLIMAMSKTDYESDNPNYHPGPFEPMQNPDHPLHPMVHPHPNHTDPHHYHHGCSHHVCNSKYEAKHQGKIEARRKHKKWKHHHHQNNFLQVYVNNLVQSQDKCKCQATQLNESPFPVHRVKAVTPANLATECYAKKGLKNVDKNVRATKCTHYNSLKLAYENSKTDNSTFSLIIEDDTIIKRKDFWQDVSAYIEGPCQSWDFTAVDISKKGEAVRATSFAKEMKMCSWGLQTYQQAIYPKVGSGTGLQIVRNSAIPKMLQFMEEEEKRDLPMDLITNHFGNVVGWYPELAAHKGIKGGMMAWREEDQVAECDLTGMPAQNAEISFAKTDGMMFDCTN